MRIRALTITMALAATTTACMDSGADSDAEDAADASVFDGSDDKADGSSWSGAELAGAVRTANTLTAQALRAQVGLTTRAANAVVAARPLAGLAALDAVRYIGPVALQKLVAYAEDQGWTTGDMVAIPAGTFTMGHPDGHRFEPRHEVQLSTYWIDRTEVTQAEWDECVAAGVCHRPNLDTYYGAGYNAQPDRPIAAVQWYQANEYCAWRGKRLPSEAMWEKAARGADDVRVHPWGDAPVSCELALVGRCQPATATRPEPVGIRPQNASPYGVVDLIGNVSEWVSDYYNEFEPTCAQPCINPEGIPAAAADNNAHGVRGASLYTIPGIAGLEVHHRWGHTWRTDIGLRCALQ